MNLQKYSLFPQFFKGFSESLRYSSEYRLLHPEEQGIFREEHFSDKAKFPSQLLPVIKPTITQGHGRKLFFKIH